MSNRRARLFERVLDRIASLRIEQIAKSPQYLAERSGFLIQTDLLSEQRAHLFDFVRGHSRCGLNHLLDRCEHLAVTRTNLRDYRFSRIFGNLINRCFNPVE
jgi:hypothetical protein